MERLTKRTPDGIAYMAIADTLPKAQQEVEGSKAILEGIYAMFQKLANFEDMAEPKTVTKGQYSEEYDSYELTCPKCNDYVGELVNEDGEGIYKYNLAYKYCPECGQKLKVDYS